MPTINGLELQDMQYEGPMFEISKEEATRRNAFLRTEIGKPRKFLVTRNIPAPYNPDVPSEKLYHLESVDVEAESAALALASVEGLVADIKRASGWPSHRENMQARAQFKRGKR
jgi:hypothetical protein